MLELLIPTILTSAADSLNPIAITQQFVLQGMVKKPRHIWFFILPTGIINLIGGFLAYFGLITVIGNIFNKLLDSYGKAIFTVELIIGIIFLISAFYIVQNSKIKQLKKQIKTLNVAESDSDEAEIKSKIKSVSPPALIALGTAATISELATALPYFAFMAILFNYQLSFIELTIILLLYNFIYTLPLIILFFVYIKAKSKFDKFYSFIKRYITKFSNILLPAVFGAVGILLLFHSISSLLH